MIFIKTTDGVSFLSATLNRMLTIKNDVPVYKKVLDAIQDDNDELATYLATEQDSIDVINVNDSQIHVKENKSFITINGERYYLSQYTSEYIRNYFKNNMPVANMGKLLERLAENPMLKEISRLSKSHFLAMTDASQEEVMNKFIDRFFRFISRSNLPINENGHVLCYKVVRADYYDKYSNTICNTIGQYVPEIPWREVDPDSSTACSQGYHVGNLVYSGLNGHYRDDSNKVLFVLVDPASVISCPASEDTNKIRVTTYFVLSECQEHAEDFSYRIVNNTPQFEPNIGMHIQFNYDGKDRDLYVKEVDAQYICGELIDPEENAGEYRKFTRKLMQHVKKV